MKRKVMASALCIMILALCTMGTAAGQPGGSEAYPVQKTLKDETVYINLNSGGDVKEVNIVNHIETPADGQYTDYGDYENITNLTDNSQPLAYQDEIRWNLQKNAKGFYYQGQLKNAVLPFLFTVTYSLNGMEMKAEELAGKAGQVKIHLKAASNEAATEYFKKNYFCQIQTALDMDTCANIQAAGATMVVSGRTQSLAYTVLPGKTAEFDLSFETSAFEFEGFTVSAILFDVSRMMDLDTDEIKDGIDGLTTGTQELADGTDDLKDGLKTLSSSVSKLSIGLNDAEDGMGDLKTGLKSYTGGVAQLNKQLSSVVGAANQLAKNAKELSANFAGLKGGVNSIFKALEAAAPPQLQAQMTALSGQMDAYASGLSDFSDGLSQMAGGLSAFAQGMDTVSANGDKLVSGMSTLIKGMSKLADGLSTIAAHMKKLPSQVGELVDGQLELKDGIEQAGKVFDDFETNPGSPVSFASSKNAPRSVQFVYKTAEIKPEKETKEENTDHETKQGFFDKLTTLFKPAG